MEFTITKEKLVSAEADIISIGCAEGDSSSKAEKQSKLLLGDGGREVDEAMGGSISAQIRDESFNGKRGSSRLFFTAGRIPAKFVLVTGLGKKKDISLDVIREVGALIAKEAAGVQAKSVALVIERGELADDKPETRAAALTEGFTLGSYSFDRYKTNDKRLHGPKGVRFVYSGNPRTVEAAITDAKIVAEATCSARDLVNSPAADITPNSLAQYCRKMAAKSKIAVKVMGADGIKKERMGAFLAVAKGSAEPPAFIEMTYKPKGKPKAHIALVGKGVTFDSGGLSLKPPASMEKMKDDMAGAAAVIAAMEAIAKLQPKVAVSAYIPAAENLPGGRATKPGDVVKSRSGKTIEILNTDAEGRLLLADALSYAVDRKPDVVIDVATLTGGALYALGELYTAALGNDQKIAVKMLAAAKESGEHMWQLPMVEEYRDGFKSSIADIKNVGKGKASAINGALFLSEFVGKTPWLHLDIAPSSWTDDDLPLAPKGATGAMVRTLVKFVMNY